MIYDNLKKILSEKYHQHLHQFDKNIIENKVLSKETIKNNPYFIINEENYDNEVVEYLKNLPKGFTYRPVEEYVELIFKIINDIQRKYIKDLTEEEANTVNQNIESYKQQINALPKEENLKNSIAHWKILISATKLYKYAREKALENIRKSVKVQDTKSKSKTNQMTISDYEKELDRRSGKLRKKGIDALIDKIKGNKQSEEPEELPSLQQSQLPKKSPEDEIKSLNSIEKFLLSVKNDIDSNLFKTAFDAIQKAKNDPTTENIQLAKELVDKALEN